jgi:hypothetical protein
MREAILNLLNADYEVELPGRGPATVDLYQVRKR